MGVPLSLPGDGRNVEVVGDYLFVSADSGGLSIFDISPPVAAAPVEIVVYGIPFDNTQQTAVSGRYIYLADGNTNGLQIVDLYPE